MDLFKFLLWLMVKVKILVFFLVGFVIIKNWVGWLLFVGIIVVILFGEVVESSWEFVIGVVFDNLMVWLIWFVVNFIFVLMLGVIKILVVLVW